MSKNPKNTSLEEQSLLVDTQNELFLQISSLVFASLDKDALLNKVATCLTRKFCDGVYIIFLGPGSTLSLEYLVTPSVSNRFKLDKNTKSSLITRDNQIGPANVIRMAQAELFNPPESDGSTLDYSHFLSSVRMSSSICVPLISRNEIIGCIGLLRSSSSQEFGFEEQIIAEEVVKPVAMGLQNARFHQKVIESEQKLSAVTNIVPTPLAYVNDEQMLIFANPEFMRTFRLAERECVGRYTYEVFPHAICEQLEKRESQVFEGIEQIFTVQYDCPVKGTLDFEIKLVPKLDQQTNTKWYLVFIQDLTEINKTHALLQSSKEEAEAANIAKTRFLANMSHEVRTPLGSIMGFAEMIAFYEDDVKLLKDHGKRVLGCSKHLLEIINGVLDLAKIEADKMEPSPECFDLGRFYNSLVDSFPENQDVALIFENSASINRTIETDRKFLRQILFNIIGNAMKFTEKGEVRVSAELINNEQLVIEVKDSGPGMRQEEENKLFKPFSQADVSNARNHEGTGLGLALSRRLANILGGNVTLKSAVPGKGCVFKIEITVVCPEVEKINLSSDELTGPSQLAHEGFLKGKKVYVVDDCADFRFLLSFYLESVGALPSAFSTPEDALQALNPGVDAILLDLQMPGTDGYKAKELFKRKGFVGPIIACSANAMQEHRENALSSDFSDYLTKPIDQKLLVETLTRNLPVN
ncbi:MAG: response regulator [Bacteriovoracaceae bacterium]|nr:response regulator [Bacteriovoracaceae bacterium]